MRFRRLFRFTSRTDDEIERDIREEVAFHLDLRVRELVEAGSSPERAQAEAQRQFGNVDATAAYIRSLDTRKERSMRWRLRAEELQQDLTYGVRMLVRQRGLTAVAVLTIALGVGATAIVFAVVHAALLAPLPYRDADRLMVTRLSVPDYRDMRESARAFASTGIWASNQYTLDDEQVLGGVMSPSVFTTLGVSAAAGRTITEDDGDSAVAVLSHALWQRRFGGDPHVVGRTVRLTGLPYTVIGVMPRGFAFPSGAFQLWTSLGAAMTQAPGQAENRALRIFQAVGRLRPGIETTEAQAELSPRAPARHREPADGRMRRRCRYRPRPMEHAGAACAGRRAHPADRGRDPQRSRAARGTWGRGTHGSAGGARAGRAPGDQQSGAVTARWRARRFGSARGRAAQVGPRRCASRHRRRRAGRRPAAHAQPGPAAQRRHGRRARSASDLQRAADSRADPWRTRHPSRRSARADRGTARRSGGRRRHRTRPHHGPAWNHLRGRRAVGLTDRRQGRVLHCRLARLLPGARHTRGGGTGVRERRWGGSSPGGRRIGDTGAPLLPGRQRRRAPPPPREPRLRGRLAHDCGGRPRRPVPGSGRWAAPDRVHALRADTLPVDVRARPHRRRPDGP